ncbi:MAG TPA: HNH endonuclease [Planctomycetes bacterium]|nr:HNH endonuclease [Planctomycetota bacterium]
MWLSSEKPFSPPSGSSVSYTGGGWIRPKRRWAIYLRDDLSCVYCRREIAHILLSGAFLTLDHLRPRPSSNAWTNLVTACSTCNNLRHREPWRSFAASMPDGPEMVIKRVRCQIRRAESKFLAAAEALFREKPNWMLFNNGAVQAHFQGVCGEPAYWPDEDRWDDPGAGHTLIDDLFIARIDPALGF